MALSPLLQSNLARNGFKTPTAIQSLAIEPALAGKDLVATAQTGTGKTLAFLLPIIQSLAAKSAPKGVRALILSPTRELAMQSNEEFLKLAKGSGLSAAVVIGGLGERPQLNAIRKGAQVLIATPGRLQDFMKRRLVDLGAVQIVVLDEADRMLDMGFLPSIRIIMDALPTPRQTLFFSATLESSVKHLVQSYVPNGVRLEVGSTMKPVDEVDLRCYEVEQDHKLGLLQNLLGRDQGSFLVFARTKHGVEKLARRLAVEGVKATAIHGDRSQNQRNQALRGFQEGSYRVLVATDVAARGIHVDGIAHVVNYDLPQVPEDFIHRVGRTARAGARGTASTFSTRLERSDLALIERKLAITLPRYNEAGEVVEARSAASASATRHWRSFGPSRNPARRQVRHVA